MSKRRSKAATLELTFLAALDSVPANVDTSEIAEIRDWSKAVRGKFYGASAKEPSRFSKLKTHLRSALRRPSATNAPGSSSGGVSGVIPSASSNVASHGNVQYSQMAIPQLIAVGISESSEEAWNEFVRRSQPLIRAVITKGVRRYGNVSHTLVDDLIQEVYLKLCAHNFSVLRKFEATHENSLLGFLNIVAANTVMDHSRKFVSSKRASEEVSKANLIAPKLLFSRDATSKPEGKIVLEEIDRVLKTLSRWSNFERDYEIFWLYYRNGLTAREIAALPGIRLSVRGVESILLRLTEQIKSALAQGTKNPEKKKPFNQNP